MRTALTYAAVAFATLATPAFANPPKDVADLIGAPAAGAETEMSNRGYEKMKNNTWWNPEMGVCVHVDVLEGDFTSVTMIARTACGQSGEAAATCPPDLPEADLAKQPGCRL
ncbi:hypothetical protein ACSBOB_11510 [Mesorhizobium sp. ASY16-5R]|uniref:hypothetical protein n=1 Tax=Mesorhizobium sp. ASY16-5R TaxID=3445772 RepID=UPI003FA11504